MASETNASDADESKVSLCRAMRARLSLFKRSKALFEFHIQGRFNVRRPIRIQILLPFALLLIAAVTSMAFVASWLAARRVEREIVGQLGGVLATIEQTSLNYTDTILLKMRGLSGAEFAALSADGRLVGATLRDMPARLDQVGLAPVLTSETRLGDVPTLLIRETTYLAIRARVTGSSAVTTLVVLYPEARWREAQWQAVWPPLVVGVGTIVLMVAISAWIADRIARRVRLVEQLMSDLANGRFSSVPTSKPRDELDDLVGSANRLSEQLAGLQQTIRRTERVRVLAQLAGGLAHQLRNCVTGARLAVQLHQRRCAASGQTQDDSLSVALQQLSLTEEHVKRLLSLSRQRDEPRTAGSVGVVIDDVLRLVGPVCQHGRVTLTAPALDAVAAQWRTNDVDGLRTALLNLVLNGTEAAGPDGNVALACRMVDDELLLTVSDSGTGPPESVRETLFEPFVTSKPEGVGLGLSLVKQALDDQGARVGWHRDGERTVFEVRLRRADRP